MKRSLFLIALLGIVVLGSCKKEDLNTYQMEYKFEGPDCWVTFLKPDGAFEAVQNVTSGSWSYTFEGQTGTEVYLAARNNPGVTGTHTITILKNGEVYQTKSGSSENDIVIHRILF